MSRYEDILHLPRPAPAVEPAPWQRGAQFSPFAALTGFDAAIEESGRMTEEKIELDEGGKELLDQQMHSVLERLEEKPRVSILWFSYDDRKAGGAYVRTTGHVQKMDACNGKLLLAEGQVIPLAEIYAITLEE